MDDATYVRRRRWSADEKHAVVAEALSSGNVIATAKRHGIQAQQIYRWRERLEERQGPTAFLPVSVAPDAVPLNPRSRARGASVHQAVDPVQDPPRLRAGARSTASRRSITTS